MPKNLLNSGIPRTSFPSSLTTVAFRHPQTNYSMRDYKPQSLPRRRFRNGLLLYARIALPPSFLQKLALGSPLQSCNRLLLRWKSHCVFATASLLRWESHCVFATAPFCLGGSHCGSATTSFCIGEAIAVLQRLPFALGKPLQFCNDFLLCWGSSLQFCNGLLLRWGSHCTFATTSFCVGTLVAILQCASFARGRLLPLLIIVFITATTKWQRRIEIIISRERFCLSIECYGHCTAACL